MVSVSTWGKKESDKTCYDWYPVSIACSRYPISKDILISKSQSIVFSKFQYLLISKSHVSQYILYLKSPNLKVFLPPNILIFLSPNILIFLSPNLLIFSYPDILIFWYSDIFIFWSKWLWLAWAYQEGICELWAANLPRDEGVIRLSLGSQLLAVHLCCGRLWLALTNILYLHLWLMSFQPYGCPSCQLYGWYPLSQRSWQPCITGHWFRWISWLMRNVVLQIWLMYWYPVDVGMK